MRNEWHFIQPLVLITLSTDTILTTTIGICWAIRFVGIKRANNISSTTVIATG